jgi:hypothetical protein
MGGSSAPMAYTPANQAGADASYTSTLNNLTAGDTANYATANQGFNQAYQSVLNNPYYAQGQQGVNASGAQQYASGTADINNANTLNGLAPSIVASGFDPTSALYNSGLKSAQDAQSIASSQAGVAGSPFAAGMRGDATTNFNTNWQAGQASKQQQAIAALASLFSSSAGTAATGAAQQQAGAAAPAQFSNANQNSIMSALQQLVTGTGGAASTVQGDVGGYGTYLGIGQNATQSQDQATQINNQSSGLGAGLGQILGMVGKIGVTAATGGTSAAFTGA